MNQYVDRSMSGASRLVLTQELLYRLAPNASRRSSDENVEAFECEE